MASWHTLYCNNCPEAKAVVFVNWLLLKVNSSFLVIEAISKYPIAPLIVALVEHGKNVVWSITPIGVLAVGVTAAISNLASAYELMLSELIIWIFSILPA